MPTCRLLAVEKETPTSQFFLNLIETNPKFVSWIKKSWLPNIIKEIGVNITIDMVKQDLKYESIDKDWSLDDDFTDLAVNFNNYTPLFIENKDLYFAYENEDHGMGNILQGKLITVKVPDKQRIFLIDNLEPEPIMPEVEYDST